MYKCTRCGKCCEHIDILPLRNKWRNLLDNGKGICVYLTSEKLCSIYERRPIICNHEAWYNEKYKDIMSYKEYDSILEKECERIRGENNERLGQDKLLSR